MSTIAESRDMLSFVNTFSDQLINYYKSEKESAQYYDQRKKISKLINEILLKKNVFSRCSKNQLIYLRSTFFTLGRSQAVRLDKEIREKITPLLDSLREKRLYLTQRSWSNFWETYDDFVKLFPQKDIESLFLHDIYNKLTSLPREGAFRLKAILSQASETDRGELFYLISTGFFYDDSLDEQMCAVINKIPCEQKIDVIRRAKSLLDESMTDRDRVYLLEAITKIPMKERLEVIKQSRQFFTIFMSPLEKAQLLGEIQKVPQEERNQVIELTFSLFSPVMKVKEIIPIIKIIDQMPLDERKEIVDRSKLLITTSRISGEEKAHILQGVLAIPKAEREILIQLENLAIIRNLSKICVNKRQTLSIFYLIPEMIISTHCKLLAPMGNILDIFIYREAIISSLEKKLSDPMLSPFTQKELAEFIDFARKKLQLHHEDWLSQQATEIRCAVDIEGEKNPFTIYRKHQRARLEASTFIPLPEFVGDKMFQINISQLKGIPNGLKITREELPKEVTLEAWKSLTEGLQRKVEGNQEAKGALGDYGITWDRLWEGSLADSYLSGLLALQKGDVSLEEAKFKAVVNNILEKESVNPSPFFTEQEDVLIKTAMSIQHCRGGKQEGIDGAYRLLDSKYHYSMKLPEGIQAEEQKQRMLHFVSNSIQNWISGQISGSGALMQAMTGAKTISQGVHQSIYVKNLIGHLLGLEHQLVFDRHTNVLYTYLVKTPKEALLRLFFTHVTPKTMINELVRAVNADLQKNSPLIGWVLDQADDWDLQADDITCQMSESGALKLLQTTGYLLSLSNDL